MTDAGFAAARVEPAPKVVQPTLKISAGTKQAMLLEMPCAPEGAMMAEITDATGPDRTPGGATPGAVKKRLGLTITSEKVEGRGRVYRIPA